MGIACTTGKRLDECYRETVSEHVFCFKWEVKRGQGTMNEQELKKNKRQQRKQKTQIRMKMFFFLTPKN